MAYQSLYRKYRPQRFADLVGAQHVTTALRNAVREGRVGHAYLFSGPRGTGKTTTARILAKSLNCTNLGDDGDPCGVCESCVAIAEGTSLDVIEVDAASKSRVEEMRELLERVAYLSAGGGKKVYILDEVHMLSPSAEAALLKTLEESPEHVVFVLATTDPLKVAPTIRSRTQHYAFTLYTVDEIQAHLADVAAREGVAAEPEALAIVARAAAGSMRDSLSLLDQAMAHGALDVEQVGLLIGGTATAGRIALLQAVVDEDVAGALVGVDELLEQGHEPRRLTEDLLASARDAFLLTSARGRVRVDAPDDDVERLSALGADAGAGRLVRILETLGQAIVDMRGADAADPRLVLEIALVRLARRDAGPPLQALAERVERLERGTTTPPPGSTSPAPAASARPAATDPVPAPDPPAADPEPPRERPSFADLKQAARGGATAARSAEASSPAPPSEPPTEIASAATETEPPDGASADLAPVDLDDVIMVWSEILPNFPPATKATAQEAQPIAVHDNVITFGVPKNLMGSARERFKREADNIRAALTDRLGRRMMFKLEPVEAFGVLPGPPAADTVPTGPSTPVADDPGAAAPVDGAFDEYDDFDFTELADAAPADAAVDSVGLLTSQFDATVVEELPRD